MPDWFFIAYGAFVALSVLEWIGVVRFWAPLYSFGLPVFSVTDPELTSPLSALDQVVETEHAKFKVVSPDRVLLREHYRFWSRQTDVRGTIDWRADGAVAVGRVSSSLIGSLVVFLILIVAMGIVGPGASSDALVPLLIAVLFPVALMLVMIAVQRSRMRALLAEYKAWSTTQRPRF